MAMGSVRTIRVGNTRCNSEVLEQFAETVYVAIHLIVFEDDA